MRKKACVFSMTRQRDEDLMRAYHHQLSIALNSGVTINQTDVILNTINSPASRYWISLERACAVIYKMRKGETFGGVKSNTRLLYMTLYGEYRQEKERHPDVPAKHLIADIIERPAPCFALTAQSANFLINRIKKKQWYIERRRLLRHLF